MVTSQREIYFLGLIVISNTANIFYNLEFLVQYEHELLFIVIIFGWSRELPIGAIGVGLYHINLRVIYLLKLSY